jgi:hypothetical protein
LQFPAKTRNMIFLVIFKKKIPKKKCSVFFESRLKRKPVKHDILKFEWSNLSKRYFLTSFLKK